MDTYDLVVDVSAFPSGWDVEVEHGHSPPGEPIRGEIEGVFSQFVIEGSEARATHLVCMYKNDLQASVSFFAEEEFPKGDWVVTPWTVPEEWTYESPVADRFEFACAELETLHRFQNCTAVAQYGEFISVFSAPVSPEHMTLENLESILKVIDERMAHHLAEQ